MVRLLARVIILGVTIKWPQHCKEKPIDIKIIFIYRSHFLKRNALTYALVILLGLEAFTLYAGHVEHICAGQRLLNAVKSALRNTTLLQIAHYLLGHAQSRWSYVL